MLDLGRIWHADQSLAFACTVLSSIDPALAHGVPLLATRALRATLSISELLSLVSVDQLSTVTLQRLGSLNPYFTAPDAEMETTFPDIKEKLETGKAEYNRRANGADRTPDILISHTAYLVCQKHLTVTEVCKWFARNATKSDRTAIRELVRELEAASESSLGVLELAHSDLRNTELEPSVRAKEVDILYAYMRGRIGSRAATYWWQQTCMKVRSSLFCWPLMVATGPEEVRQGVSLPFGAVLHDDAHSRVTIDGWSESSLALAQDWQNSVTQSLPMAQRLWRSQNGRLFDADDQAAQRKASSSLVVDCSAACTIVDTVFNTQSSDIYTLRGRSADAYWVQVALSLLLPNAELPNGVITGKITPSVGNDYKITPVKGIDKKLLYANAAGFSRVILAGDDDATLDVAMGSEELTVSHEVAKTSVSAGKKLTAAEQQKAEVAEYHEARLRLGLTGRLELNYCENARVAADAMHPSGWRRASFIRMHETQRAFSSNLRRLHLEDQIKRNEPIDIVDRKFISKNRWTESDNNLVSTFDELLLSRTQSVKHVKRANLEAVLSKTMSGDQLPNLEAELGKWLGWRDHFVRTDEMEGGPALGILCIRTAERDSEMALWATIADALSASTEWWERFQWASRDQAAMLLSELLCNRKADPAVSLVAAPDVLVILDEGGFTHNRTNPIFPDDFRGQWLDLLNPSRDDGDGVYSTRPLSYALNMQGEFGFGKTRIITVYGEAQTWTLSLKEVTEAELNIATVLSTFRFGFTPQAGLALVNAVRDRSSQMGWLEFNSILSKTVRKGVFSRSRGQYYLRPEARRALTKMNAISDDPVLHFHAARALTPIIEPSGQFASTNRDRTLEHENIIEALWHLNRARWSSTPRFHSENRARVIGAHSNLIYINPFPDWDTVKQLRHRTETLIDAYELGEELLEEEKRISDRQPHSSRYGLLIAVLGDVLRNGTPKASQITRLGQLFDEAEAAIESGDHGFAIRQRRKLCSDFLYAVKKAPAGELIEQRAKATLIIENTVHDIMANDFLPSLQSGSRNMDDYPLQSDWLDEGISSADNGLEKRLEFATVGIRLSAERLSDSGTIVRQTKHSAWVDYFCLAGPEFISKAQAYRSSPLDFWRYAYEKPETQSEFRQWVGSRQSFVRGNGLSPWNKKVQQAALNLWEFATRLKVKQESKDVETALSIVRDLVAQETLPCFAFLTGIDRKWIETWPQRTDGIWSSITQDVITSVQGWVYLLSRVNLNHSKAADTIKSWLNAHRAFGGKPLSFSDPERLLTGSNWKAEPVRQFEWSLGKSLSTITEIGASKTKLPIGFDDVELNQLVSIDLTLKKLLNPDHALSVDSPSNQLDLPSFRRKRPVVAHPLFGGR